MAEWHRVAAAADLMEGRMASLLGPIVREAGKSLANAVSEAREAVDFLRRAGLLPTVAESGYKGFEVTTWYGLFGPAGLPRDIVQKLGLEQVVVWACGPHLHEKTFRRACSGCGETPYLKLLTQLFGDRAVVP